MPGSTKPIVLAAYFSRMGGALYAFLIKYIKIYVLFIVLFAHTGLSKLLDFINFQFSIWKVQLLRPYYYPLSFIIPISEFIIACLLAFPVIKIGKLLIPSRKFGLYGSLILMLLFTGYLGYLLFFYSGSLPCTCGGVISTMTWKQHLVFNVIFSFLAFRAIFLYNRQKQMSAK